MYFTVRVAPRSRAAVARALRLAPDAGCTSLCGWRPGRGRRWRVRCAWRPTPDVLHCAGGAQVAGGGGACAAPGARRPMYFTVRVAPRSRAAVARALRLAPDAGSEGEGGGEGDPTSPRVHVDMAEEDVAAMLLGMTAPARQCARPLCPPACC